MSTVVVCLGNRYRGDDGAGLAVADRLQERRLPADVAVVRCEQEPTRLVDAWRGADFAVVVDACSSGAPPGTVHRFDASEEPVPSRALRSSTHAFGVGDAIELGRALRELPRRVLVLGIEGLDFAAGTELTPAVEAAVAEVAAAVEGEVRCTSVR